MIDKQNYLYESVYYNDMNKEINQKKKKIVLEVNENQLEILQHMMLNKIYEHKKNGETESVKIWYKHFSNIFLNGDMSKWSEL